MLAQNWRLPMKVVESATIQLEIGMDSNATDKFDRDIDLPAPPVPPTFYAFIPYSDPEIPFLPALWKDIRASGDSALWAIIIANAVSSIIIRWDTTRVDSIDGDLTIDGKNITTLKGQIELPAKTAKIDVKYSKGKKTNVKDPSVEIRFNVSKRGKVKIIFYNKAGIIADSLYIGAISGEGERKIRWNPGKLPPGVYIYKIIVDSDTVDFGKTFVVFP